MSLTPKFRHELRAKAHKLKPVVMIGDKGLTENVIKELKGAIEHHELIKVKISGADKESRLAVTTEICAVVRCEPVQNIGNIVVLYRKNHDKNKKITK
jgi:RNA-binding protein